MIVQDFIKTLFEAGKEKGISDMEVFIQGTKDLELMVFKSEIDKYSKAEEKGLSFRGIYQGKMGYSYTEKLDGTSINLLVDGVISNAKVIDSDDEEIIFQGSEHYEVVDTFNQELDKITPEDKIAFIKALEQEALSIDDRVKAINYCFYGDQSLETIMINTNGLNLESKSNAAFAYISAMVKEEDDVKTAARYIVSSDFSNFNPKDLANEAVKEALSLLGAKSIKSDNYPVILRNNVAANFLQAYSNIFSAESVQKGLSLLKGKLNQKVAAEELTIVDNPFMSDGVASQPFDSEGVATRFKKVIDNGTLTTYLHNYKSAKKDGVESTGNAFKSSYKAPITIAPTNMYIEKGNKELDDMIKEMDNGLMIIDVQGIHSGVNTVSGDFSLSATGYEIKDGKITRPVNQITIAGNLFDVLKDVVYIGKDLKFALPNHGYIGSPSLKIKGLAVSGE